MKALGIALSLVLGVSAVAFGQSAKATLKVGKMAKIEGTNTAFQTVAKSTIKTSNPADLLIGVSLETTLYTETSVASKSYEKSSSTAEAGVEVQVLVDGQPAAPGKVVFDRRKQTLAAMLDGFSCTDLNHDGIVTYDECTLTPEEIQLILDTTGAHHFNFAAGNVGTGVHTVEVQARLVTFTESTGGSTPTIGSTKADAFIGNGSLAVESVRMVNTGDAATVALQ